MSVRLLTQTYREALHTAREHVETEGVADVVCRALLVADKLLREVVKEHAAGRLNQNDVLTRIKEQIG